MSEAWRGTLEAIYTAPTAGAPMEARDAVRAEPGHGLEGDRYWKGEGAFSRWPGPRREVTLITAEAVEAAEREFEVTLTAGEHRRNLVTRGVPLTDLVKHPAAPLTATLQIPLPKPRQHLFSYFLTHWHPFRCRCHPF